LASVCLAAGADARVPLSAVSASHDLPTKYAVAKAIDGDPKTHWAARNAPPQWIRVDLARPARVDTLRILGVSAQRIYDNWRRVTVSFSDGSTFTVTLADAWQWHTVAFPARETQWVKLMIESTYKRRHYVGCEEVELRFTDHKRRVVEVAPKPAAKPDAAVQVDKAWEPTEADKKLLTRLAPSSQTEREHPNLWVNAADVERAKVNVRARRWAFDYFRNTLRRADEWAAKSDDEIRRLVPKPYAVFDKKAPCPKCGKPTIASFERVGRAYCAKCDMALPNEEYPDDGQGWKNPKTGKMHYFVGLYNGRAIHAFDKALRALADAYALTAEEEFARAASVLFDALAVIYPTCDKGPKWYPGVGGRLNRPFYQTARTLIYYADEYDLLYYSPEWQKPSVDHRHKTRRENVEKNFLENGGEYCYQKVLHARTKSLNNGYCDYLQGALAVGRVLGIQRYIDYVLESEMSIFNFVENTIDRDGQYFETAFMYSSHAITLFSHHAEMLRNYRSAKFPDRINLYDHPKLKLAFLRSERDIECAGHVPPLGDTGPDLEVIRLDQRLRINPRAYGRLEYLAARAGAPEERAAYVKMLRDYVDDADQARMRSNMARWLTFNAVKTDQTGERESPARDDVRNTLLSGSRGIGVLRTGTAGETAVLLRWGPTLNHGSPDELNLNMFAHGREVTYDPGYLWAHHRQGWAHATGSHNLVLVNEANQLAQPGSGGDLELWFQGSGVRAVSANDPLCYAKENVSRYQRTLVLVDLSPTQHYLLDVFRVAGGHTHDLNWHFVGDMCGAQGVTLPKPQTNGSLAGPQYEWWKLIQPDGWLRGVNKRFYWTPPPGNGYGFIFNLQRAPAEGKCAFDWKIGERASMPRWTFDPATRVGESSGKLRKPLGVGSYFYRGEEPGDFIEFSLPVDVPGEYVILAVFYKSSHYGVVKASLDEKGLGDRVNTYSPSGYFSDPIVLGRRRLKRGQHRLRLSVVGRDPESSGHYFSVKYLALEKPEFLKQMRRKEVEMVRLNLLPAPETEIIVGRAKGASRWPDATYVISRRKGEALNTQFVSLVEPCVGEPQVVSIDRMQSEAEQDAESVAALRIATRDGRIDYVFEAARPMPVGTYSHGGERVRFGGRFGVARTQGGRAVSLALHGSGELSIGDRHLRSAGGEYRGSVSRVDVNACAVYTDAALPTDGSLNGCVIQFENPAYTRRSPFLIKRVAREADRTRVELDTASLVLARGLVGSETAPPGVIPNLVPLDRERMVRRGYRTLYFQGKRILADDARSWGRVKDVSVRTWHITSTEPVRTKAGERFSIIEVSPGDEFRVLQTATRRF